MTLYQIETVKVPITDTNIEADSYTETAITKPYLASNKEYYIQLVLPELVMCKKIRGTFYCEELFLVKHKTKLSCESAIFYNLTRDVILENCQFNYFYNTTVLPSILDGGSHILLANMLNPKRLICSHDCTVSLSVFAGLAQILRRFSVFAEEPHKSIITATEPCNQVFKEAQPRPSTPLIISQSFSLVICIVKTFIYLSSLVMLCFLEESCCYNKVSSRIVLASKGFSVFFWITLSHEVSRHFPIHTCTSTYVNFENLLYIHCTLADIPLHDQGLAKHLPTSSYALVSRDILCYCHLQIGLTYILKSIALCNITTALTLEYTVNLAFMDYFQSFWTNGTLSHIPLLPSIEEIVLLIAMKDYTKDPQFLLYGKDIKRNLNTLAELSQIIHQKQKFLKSRKELFSKPKADIRLPETSLSKRSKSSFLFSAIFHIYIFVGSSVGIMWLIPCILFAMKQRKMKTLVSAMALHQAKPIEVVAASTSMPAEQTEALITTSVPSLLEKLTGMDIPTNQMTKLVCYDPWVSFIVTLITIVGVVVYVYRNCRHMSFLKGHKFASICHVHIIFCNNTRYVPLKIGHYIGSPFLFQYNELPLVENITLHRHCLWDILHVEWDEERIHYKDRSIPLREHLNVPLKDKLRLRWILKKNYQIMYMVKQGDTWYNLTKL